MRIFLAIARILGLIVHQVDIAGAYLESLLGDNDQPIYVYASASRNRSNPSGSLLSAVEKPLWTERIRKTLE